MRPVLPHARYTPLGQVAHLPALVIRDRLADLLGAVHDERSVPHNGFLGSVLKVEMSA
jgi:hypothetical protein